MTTILYCPMKDAPYWVKQWLYAHPAFLQYHNKFREKCKLDGHFSTTEEVRTFILELDKEVGLNIFSLRDEEIWITLHDYDIIPAKLQ
jgi:hypothetical protein